MYGSVNAFHIQLFQQVRVRKAKRIVMVGGRDVSGKNTAKGAKVLRSMPQIRVYF